MSALENLSKRLNYYGGSNQQTRMNTDKLRSLKKSLLYSYQAATAVLADGREFRCLINPDKIKMDYDIKEISIPFEDVCLNAPRIGKTNEGIQPIGMKAGDIFQWQENGSYWITYLQNLDETAYYRAEIRRCRYEIEMDGKLQRAYVKGPIETTIDWHTKNKDYWNNLNYTLEVIVPLNEETEAFFHRFSVIRFKGKRWEVQTIDNISTEGIIDVYLKEEYSNSIEDAVKKEDEEKIPEITIPIEDEATIIGDDQVYPYDVKVFTIENSENGVWRVDNNKVKILQQNSSQLKLEIITGKSGKFNISYEVNNIEVAKLPVTILSL